MFTNHHGIIFSANEPQFKKSAIIFNKKYVLAPAPILLNTIDEFNNLLIKSNTNLNIENNLKTYQLIDCLNDKNFELLKLIKFFVIHENFNNTNKNNNNNNNNNKNQWKKSVSTFIKTETKLLYIFNCRNISKTINNILNGFSINDLITKNLDDNLEKIFLSSFLLLKLELPNFKNRSPTNGNLQIIDELITKISQHLIVEEDSYNLVTNSKDTDIVMKSQLLNKLENIASVSTPFGNEIFFNTINIGKITNLFGYDNCLMSISMPLVNGCEGGAVYNGKQDLIGIVIWTTFEWRNQNAALPVIANFSEIIKEFLEQTKQTKIKIIEKTDLDVNRVVNYKNENSVVLLQIGSTWGTGCLLRVRNTKFIITCSHVIEGAIGGYVTCHWKNGKFQSKIIYKHPNLDEPYDIAILEVSDNTIPDEYFAECSKDEPKIGQTIYTIGFPLFSTLGTYQFSPSISEGKITKTVMGMFFTDANVQAGQSGAPIFSSDGKLLGICVSNSKNESENIIYPNINMSVPIFDIYTILDKYVKSGDSKELNKLVAGKYIKKAWALETPRIISKL